MITSVADRLLDARVLVTSCDQIQRQVEKEQQVKLGSRDVYDVMKKSMRLSYRRVRKVPVQAN